MESAVTDEDFKGAGGQGLVVRARVSVSSLSERSPGSEEGLPGQKRQGADSVIPSDLEIQGGTNNGR